jgi:hypothetical protein
VLDQSSRWLHVRRKPRAIETRYAGRVAVTLMLAAALLGAGNSTAGATPPDARQIDASQATGCCVCRGTARGEQGSIKSCADGKTVGDCLTTCRGEGAASIGFGYQQTCSVGCAGFPTQNK